MRDIIDSISEEVNSYLEKESTEVVPLDDVGAETRTISKDDFKEIRLHHTKTESTFIDGGIASIISAPSISVDFIRLASVTYNTHGYMAPFKREYFCLSKIVEESDNLFYMSKLIPCDDSGEPHIRKIRIDDGSLRDGNNIGSMSRFLSMVLRFEELDFAKIVASRSSRKSLLVLDGSLICSYDGEDNLMNSLSYICQEKDILLQGIPKTNSLFTDSGQDIVMTLRKLEKDSGFRDKMWFNGPLLTSKEGSYMSDVYYAKLHKAAKNIFRVEFDAASSMIDYHKVMGTLASLSGDPVFLGYPYPLIKVDQFARVTNNEKSQLRARFLNKVKIDDIESSSNSHNILDNIMF